MVSRDKVAGVKLIRTYKHGWLWIEKNVNGQWRFRFGTIFEDGKTADFIYSAWHKPFVTENELTIFVSKIVRHYENQYDPQIV